MKIPLCSHLKPACISKSLLAITFNPEPAHRSSFNVRFKKKKTELSPNSCPCRLRFWVKEPLPMKLNCWPMISKMQRYITYWLGIVTPKYLALDLHRIYRGSIYKSICSVSILLSRFHSQHGARHGAWTHDPEIKPRA